MSKKNNTEMVSEEEIKRLVNELTSDLDSPNKLDAKEIAFMKQQIEADNKIDGLENLTTIELRRLIRMKKLEKIVKTILWPIRRFYRLFSNRLGIVI